MLGLPFSLEGWVPHILVFGNKMKTHGYMKWPSRLLKFSWIVVELPLANKAGSA